MKHSYISILRDADWLTPERILRIAVIFASVEVVALIIQWWLQTRLEFALLAGAPLGEDFVNYWAGAHLAVQGHAATVYDPIPFLNYEHTHLTPFPMFRWYAYPPVALLLSAPLSLLPYYPAYFLWLLGGTGLCALLFSRSMRWSMALLAAFAMPAVFLNAVSGQNGQFTAALLAGAIMLLDRRPIVSGILFGMLCYKPHLGILIPFALAVDHRGRTFLSASLTVAALVGGTLLLFGQDTWTGYLHAAPMNMNNLILNQGQSPDPSLVSKDSPFIWNGMPTVFAGMRLIGAGSMAAYAIQALSAVAALFVTIMVWRGVAPSTVKGAALVIATFLVTPYAWSYDLVILTFAIVWLWQDASRDGFFPWEKSALAGTLAMTLFFGSIGKLTHVPIAPILLWIALLFAARRALVFSAWKMKAAD